VGFAAERDHKEPQDTYRFSRWIGVEENAMDHPIETSRQPDGRWVATVSQIPGLAAFGQSQVEVLIRARQVCAILLDEDVQRDEGILAIYPGEIPGSSQPEYSIEPAFP
jgi:predicted RNase H-like HicB family nuclease